MSEVALLLSCLSLAFLFKTTHNSVFPCCICSPSCSDISHSQELPADLIILSTSDEENVCHVETANLDGVCVVCVMCVCIWLAHCTLASALHVSFALLCHLIACCTDPAALRHTLYMRHVKSNEHCVHCSSVLQARPTSKPRRASHRRQGSQLQTTLWTSSTGESGLILFQLTFEEPLLLICPSSSVKETATV